MSKSAELKYRYNLPREVFDYLEKLENVEQQKAELIEIAKEYSYLLLSQQSYDFNNEHDLKRGEEIETLLENIT